MRLATSGDLRTAEGYDGTLMLDAATGFLSETGYRPVSLYHAGSSDTFCVSSSCMQEQATAPIAPPFEARWVVRTGTVEGVSLDSTAGEDTRSVITFGETYSDASEIRLFLQITQDNNSLFRLATGDDIFIGVNRVSTETAESLISYLAGANAYPDLAAGATKVNIAWISEGTVAY